MSAAYLATNHSSLETSFWKSLTITPNLKNSIAQAFPDDDVPLPTMQNTNTELSGSDLNYAKMIAVKNLFTETVRERDIKLDSKDKLRFITRHTLGMICEELGQWKEAEAVFTQLLEESDKILGPDSNSSMGAVSHLGTINKELGRYPEAEARFKRGKDLLGKTKGKESPQYLGHIRALIPILAKQGKYDEADKLVQEGTFLVGNMTSDFKTEETEEMERVVTEYKVMKK